MTIKNNKYILCFNPFMLQRYKKKLNLSVFYLFFCVIKEKFVLLQSYGHNND